MLALLLLNDKKPTRILEFLNGPFYSFTSDVYISTNGDKEITPLENKMS